MTSRQSPSKYEPYRPLHEAARDFFFLQNRGYPRRSALEWVGNRYELFHLERQLLHRGVFSQEDALRRLARRSRGVAWEKEWLVVDGHNVQITVESAVLGRPVLRANDGAIRDLAGQSAEFRLTEASELALDLIFRFLGEFPPARTLFFFDAPISQSGQLAHSCKQRMNALGLRGAARAVPVPEREFPNYQGIVASSDQAVMEKAERWVDLAGLVLHFSGTLQLREDFSSIILSRTVYEQPADPLGFS
jgi:hypothetical protein